MINIIQDEIANNKNHLSISMMCDILGISRTYYYSNRKKLNSKSFSNDKDSEWFCQLNLF